MNAFLDFNYNKSMFSLVRSSDTKQIFLTATEKTFAKITLKWKKIA